MKALMDQVVQDDNANNDQKKNSKPNENSDSPGKSFTLRSIGGIFRIRIEVSLAFLFSDLEFRYCFVSLWIRWWKVHHLFVFLLKTEPLLCAGDAESAALRIAICYTHI